MAAALAVSLSPTIAGAQRNQMPGPDTKRALVTTFRGDVEGGVKAANEIRDRIQGEYSIKVLMPISKKNIDITLTGSGYKPDSALSPSDIKELARQLSADEVIDGDVTKTATGFRVKARLFLPRDPNLSQPLITVESKDFGDIARQVVDEYDKARKQIPDNQACENGLRASNVSQAIAAARKGIQGYPKSTLLRLCIAQAFASQKATVDSTGPWKDSVIAVTKSVLDLDPKSNIALRLEYDAFKSKGDMPNAMATLVAMLKADPSNSTLRDQVIAELVTSGQAALAVPIVKQMVAENSGDPQSAKTYWQVLHATGKHDEDVIAAGKAMVALDSTLADSNYFFRQISDLTADSAWAKAAEMATAGVAKYPTNVSLLLQKAQNERKAGQLPAAKATLERLLSVDPKAGGANYILSQIASETGNVDDAIKYAKADAALNPANKQRAAALLLSAGVAVYKAGDVSKKADDYKKALPILQASDDMAPTNQAKYYIGVAAYQTINALRDALAASHTCEDFKAANELLTAININMPAGGALDPNTAKIVLANAAQYQPFVDGSTKRFCK
ncbi:MAG: hypothetical protein ABJE47_11725 [bacterium]